MKCDREFELKLDNGKVVKWPGRDGIDAAKRYVDCHKAAVVAWRQAPTVGIFLYNSGHNIIS